MIQHSLHLQNKSASWTDNLIYLNCLNRRLYYPINKSKIVNQSLVAGFTSKSRFIERKHLYLCLSIFSLHFSLIKKKKKRKSNYSVYLSVQLQIQLFHDYGEQSKGGKKCVVSGEVNYAKLNGRGGANGHLESSSLSVDAINRCILFRVIKTDRVFVHSFAKLVQRWKLICESRRFGSSSIACSSTTFQRN